MTKYWQWLGIEQWISNNRAKDLEEDDAHQQALEWAQDHLCTAEKYWNEDLKFFLIGMAFWEKDVSY